MKKAIPALFLYFLCGVAWADGSFSGSGSWAAQVPIASSVAASAVGVAQLSATGTPGATTFLRGDNTWAIPAGTGATLAANQIFTGTNTFAGVVLGSASVVDAYNPSFGAVTSGSTSTVTWTEVTDRLSEFVTSSFTAITAGYYEITAAADASQTAGQGCLLIKNNGTTVAGGTSCATGATALLTVLPIDFTRILNLAANDIVRIDASATSANVTFTNMSLVVRRVP